MRRLLISVLATVALIALGGMPSAGAAESSLRAAPTVGPISGQLSKLQRQGGQFLSESSARAEFKPERGRWSGEYTDETGTINFTVDRTKKYRRAHVRARVRGHASCNGHPVAYDLEGDSKRGWVIGYVGGEKYPTGGFGFGGPSSAGGQFSVYMLATYMSPVRARGYVRVKFWNDPDLGYCDLYTEWYATRN